MSQTAQLPDGRKLGYIELGDPNGKPVFFWSGGSRMGYPHDVSIPQALGVRLISLDRPGLGLSDFQPNRTLLDWPDDLTALADTLNIERFTVTGLSQGGPFALACAYKIPQRLTAAAVLSGLAPFQEPGVMAGMTFAYRTIPFMANGAPWLLRAMTALQSKFLNGERFGRMLENRFPESDKAVLRQRPDLIPMLVEDGLEVYRQGIDAIVQDIKIVCGDWGFRLRDITMPVYLWQGEDDRNVPPAMGRYIASAVRDCRATFYPNEGHLMAFTHWRDILTTLSTA